MKGSSRVERMSLNLQACVEQVEHSKMQNKLRASKHPTRIVALMTAEVSLILG